MKNREFLKHAFVAFVVRSLGATALVSMNLLVTRNMSINDAGLFFLAFSLFTAVGMFCTMGFTQAFLKFIGVFYKGGNWSGINAVVSIGLRISIFGAFIFSGIMVFFAEDISVTFFAKPELFSLIQIIFVGLPAFVCFQLLAFFLLAINKADKSVTLTNISVPFLVMSFIFIFISLGFGLNKESISYIFLLSVLFTGILSIIWWAQYAKREVKPDYSVVPELIKTSRSLWIMIITALIIQYSGQIIIGRYSSSEDVALFSVAQRISMLISFALLAINLVAAPKFAALSQKEDIAELRGISLLCSRLMLAVAIPCFIFLFSFPKYILQFFGPEYTQAALILKILVIGQFINVMSGCVYYLLTMTGHETEMRNIMVFSGVLALVLLNFLTPLYGPYGAALATSVSLATQNLIAVYFVKKRLGINTLNPFKQ